MTLRAILAPYDKSGLVDLARGLEQLGVQVRGRGVELLEHAVHERSEHRAAGRGGDDRARRWQAVRPSRH